MIHKKVKFKGEIYWLHEGPYGYNLSPLNHYDDEGNLLADLFDISYAVIENGKIMRFHEQIGSESELEEIYDVT